MKRGSIVAIGYARAREIFECSEYERAANSLSKALKCIETLRTSENSSSSSSFTSSSSLTSSHAFIRTVEQRAHKAMETLVLKIKNRLEDILAVAVSACNERKEKEKKRGEDEEDLGMSSHGHVTDSHSLQDFPERSFSHCLRALVMLGRGGTAERVVAETIVLPLARNMLTQGRVDGTGGRGSFSGLRESLDNVLSDIRYALLTPFRLAEATNPTLSEDDENCHIPSVDFLVNGIWLPITTHIADKFPNMFTVGIADTMFRAYGAIEGFTANLSRLLLGESGDEDGSICSVVGRLRFHPSIIAFHSRWKLDLYYQVNIHPLIVFRPSSLRLHISSILICVLTLLLLIIAKVPGAHQSNGKYM